MVMVFFRSKILYCINCSLFVIHRKKPKKKILVQLVKRKAEQNEWAKLETEFEKNSDL
jgi:Zn-finger protein